MIPATERVASASPDIVDRYKSLRRTAMDESGQHRFVCEVAIVAQLAALGHENSFKVHAMQLMAGGLARQELFNILASGIGVTLVIPQLAQIMDWLDDAAKELDARAARQG